MAGCGVITCGYWGVKWCGGVPEEELGVASRHPISYFPVSEGEDYLPIPDHDFASEQGCIPMTRTVAALAGLLISTQALAWNHTGRMWADADLPVSYWIYEHPATFSDIPTGEQYQIIQDGYAAWDAAACSKFEGSYEGLRQGMDSDNPELPPARDPFDKDNTVHFGDALGLITGGTLGVTYTQLELNPPQEVTRVFGNPIYRSSDSDIVFNENVRWWTNDMINAGGCTDAFSLQSVATHEIGHLIGLDHPCEQEDVNEGRCTEAEWYEATMFWSIGPCQVGQSVIKSDDIESIDLLYGATGLFQCSNELDAGEYDTNAIGVVPFTLRCQTQSQYRDSITTATWFWGDGESSTGLEPDHEYTEAGAYTVQACYEGTLDACGDWEYCDKRERYAVACDIPEASFFVDPVKGLRYQFFNQTDLSVQNCVSAVRWNVYEGTEVTGEPIGTIDAWSPEFDFPSGGDYTVVLNVGGIAGTGAAKTTLNIRRVSANCSATGGSAGWLLAPLALLAIRRRD